MSKREIFFGGGNPYRACDIVYAELSESGNSIAGKYIIVREDSGAEHIAYQGYGTWMAPRLTDLILDLKELDDLRAKVERLEAMLAERMACD